ncbi:SF0329 family protein [Bacillus nakamurai]|uniref:SF0329 family protein n=1 Tax=Bacillus nakamurai TaxID=1793963 RepID=UPI0040385938
MQNQHWSKTKQQLEHFLCESLRHRVCFHNIRYRKAPDRRGRAFITVDKKEVFNMCTITSARALYKKEHDMRIEQNIKYDISDTETNRKLDDMAHEQIKTSDIFAQYEFLDAAIEFLNMPIQASLQSNHLLIKIFAVLDRRTGKRRLRRMKDLYPVNMTFYSIFIG